jgi:nucleotide-binding universal stress UspA family protein
MTRPVLVGYDPETLDHAPVHFGVAVARVTGAPLVVASVDAGILRPADWREQAHRRATDEVDDDLVADCTETLGLMEEELRDSGVPYECRKLRGRSAAAALHDAAADAGLLVVGSTTRGGIGRVLLGSTAERLLQGAPCPVAVAPRRGTLGAEIATIGAAYVDAEESRSGLRAAYLLAHRAGAKLRVITVVHVPPTASLETEAQTHAQRAKTLLDVLGEHQLVAERSAKRALAELGGDVEASVESFIGDPAEVLVDLSTHLDVLVCGSRGYGPLGAVLLGGISRRLLSGARCPVIVLPRGAQRPLEDLLATPEAAVAA